MLSAFAIFCLLVATGVTAAYRYSTTPRTRPIMALVEQPNAAFLRRSGLVRTEMLVDRSSLSLGDRVIISPLSPSGIAARLQTGGASIALWPATSALVEQNDRGALRLRFEGGQAMVDIPAEGRSLFVSAGSLPQEVELTAPGRYRVRELSDQSPITARAEWKLAPGVEITTERGFAHMGEVPINAGERLIAHGKLDRDKNRWSLVRDGDFSQFTADEYRATLHPQGDLRKADTWVVSRQALAEGSQSESGLFYLGKDCAASGEDPLGEAGCRNAVRLVRLGGNEKSSITALTQDISADVSSYRSVVLEADVRVDYQSLSKGGAEGTECPLFARVNYANSKQTGLEHYFCFWAYDGGTGAISQLPYIASRQVPPEEWYRFKQDLREVIPDLRVVEKLVFYSNGHDYDAGVADVALWAEGLTDALQP